MFSMREIREGAALTVPGVRVTLHYDLKQLYMMQLSPEAQRSLSVLVSERIDLRGTMTDNRVRWGVCRKSHRSTQTCGHKLSFSTFSI